MEGPAGCKHHACFACDWVNGSCLRTLPIWFAKRCGRWWRTSSRRAICFDSCRFIVLGATSFVNPLCQEFLARGFQLRWINVTGHNVGTQVGECSSFLKMPIERQPDDRWVARESFSLPPRRASTFLICPQFLSASQKGLQLFWFVFSFFQLQILCVFQLSWLEQGCEDHGKEGHDAVCLAALECGGIAASSPMADERADGAWPSTIEMFG